MGFFGFKRFWIFLLFRMKIRSLETTPLYLIIDCLLESFKDYFVTMPPDLSYWETRFRAARVDLKYSYGMFENEKLIGFIINGIDTITENPTAFNTGTGVLPTYRGNRIVDRLYQHATPLLKESGISHCRLEVIFDNKRAIKVYQGIGFHIARRLHCFKGNLAGPKREDLLVKKTSHQTIFGSSYPDEKLYSWDHSRQAVLASGKMYQSFLVLNNLQQELGYFTFNPSTGYLARLEKAEVGTYGDILNAVKQVAGEVKMNNVDETRTSLRTALTNAGLKNFIDQYEMEMKL